MMVIKNVLDLGPLGKTIPYKDNYSPQCLFSIPREYQRELINVPKPSPFYGFDLWNAYELSWLNLKGKPVVACAYWEVPADSPNLIESKSIKLYLNSFNQSTYKDNQEVADTLSRDLSASAGASIKVHLYDAKEVANRAFKEFSGTNLDALDITCHDYHVNPDLLHCTTGPPHTETVYSHLLKSNCLATHQPDWASVQITYTGKPIIHDDLLRYLVSYRQHNEFHEQCVERLFMDILLRCEPISLTIYARYTRRGGLDINPIRSTESHPIADNSPLFRQ